MSGSAIHKKFKFSSFFLCGGDRHFRPTVSNDIYLFPYIKTSLWRRVENQWRLKKKGKGQLLSKLTVIISNDWEKKKEKSPNIRLRQSLAHKFRQIKQQQQQIPPPPFLYILEDCTHTQAFKKASHDACWCFIIKLSAQCTRSCCSSSRCPHGSSQGEGGGERPV